MIEVNCSVMRFGRVIAPPTTTAWPSNSKQRFATAGVCTLYSTLIGIFTFDSNILKS